MMKVTGNSRIQGFIPLLVLSTGLCFVSPAFAQLQRLYILDLNSNRLITFVPHGMTGNATGINNAGQVAGYTIKEYRHAFITGPTGAGRTDLKTLGGGSSATFGINDA